jgi:hypothetical protein
MATSQSTPTPVSTHEATLPRPLTWRVFIAVARDPGVRLGVMIGAAGGVALGLLVAAAFAP